MTRKLGLLLVALLAGGLIAAGCGGDDGDNGGGNGGGGASQEESGNGGDGVSPSDPRVKQAVENCERNVRQAPQLSDEVKKDLVEICQQAAEGDEEALREASRDVCKRIVEETAPAGPARDQALEACEQQSPSR